MIVTEIPGIFPDVLGRGTEHCALNRNAPVQAVIMPGRQQTFNGDSE